MNSIILPIKPKYSNGILDNKKKFELRRMRPKKDIEQIIIYETAPTMKIVGKCKISEIVYLPLKELWDITKINNMLSKKEFYEYFKGKEKGYAFLITEIHKFNVRREISHYNMKMAPQGFIYHNDDEN